MPIGLTLSKQSEWSLAEGLKQGFGGPLLCQMSFLQSLEAGVARRKGWRTSDSNLLPSSIKIFQWTGVCWPRLRPCDGNSLSLRNAVLEIYLDVPHLFRNPLLLPICALMQDRVLDLLFRFGYHCDMILCLPLPRTSYLRLCWISCLCYSRWLTSVHCLVTLL